MWYFLIIHTIFKYFIYHVCHLNTLIIITIIIIPILICIPLNILLTQNVDELIRDDQDDLFHKVILNFHSIIFSPSFHIWKACFVYMGVFPEPDKDLMVHSACVHLEGRITELMSMSLEIFSVFVRIWYSFRNMYSSSFTFI